MYQAVMDRADATGRNSDQQALDLDALSASMNLTAELHQEKEDKPQRGIPAGLDGLVSNGCGRLICVSKDFDAAANERHEYALIYAWTPPSDEQKRALRVISCSCYAHFASGKCDHAVLADQMLNAPPIAAALLTFRDGQTKPVEIVKCHRAGGARCARCDAQLLDCLLYTPPFGSLFLGCCSVCKNWRVRH